MTTVPMEMDDFTRGYIECAFWSSMDESTPEGGEPLDRNYGPADLAPEALAKMVADCQKFQADNQADLDTYPMSIREISETQAGHDFWLTRNRHGAGFRDRDCLSTEVGARLTEASRRYRECNLVVGDSGLIYCE